MASMINTNIASLMAQRNLSKSQDSLNTSLQRLSSGLRINSAKDDAAGLAISTRMTSQINGMNQAVRNANDGISLAQTADSSLDEVTNNLQRIRDLALQAANGTNSADDRAALDLEVQQRLAEVNRIASQTTFNGINLLDGSFSGQQFQIGASANQTVTIANIASAKATDLGLGAGTTTGTALASTVATTGIAAGSLSINGSTVTTDATTNSAKALAAAINGNTAISATGVTAVATNKVSAAFTTVAATQAGQQGTALASEQLPAANASVLAAGVATGGLAAGSLVLNGTTITTSSSTKSAALLAQAVNAQSATTGVTASASSSTAALGTFTTTTSSVYNLSVGSSTGGTVSVLSSAAIGTTAANVDTALNSASVKQALTTAGISFTGSAAAGTLQFTTNDGANIVVAESGGDAGTSGTHNKGFSSYSNNTASVTTMGSISLHSASDITVDGNPSTVGLTTGTYAGKTQNTVLPNVTSLDVGSSIITGGIADKALKINGTDISNISATQGNNNSAKDIAANINAKASITGVYATAQQTDSAQLGAFTTFASVGAGTDNYSLSVQTGSGGALGTSVSILAGGLNGTSAADIDTALQSSTVKTNLAAAGITVSGTAAAGTLKFSAADGSNIKLTEAMTGGGTGGFTNTLAGSNASYGGNIQLSSTSAITIADGSGGTAATAGLKTGTYGGVAAGSLTLNGTTITTDSTTVGADKLAAAINNQSTTTGVTATASATDTGALGAFTTSVSAGYGLSINGVKIIDSATSTSGVKAADIDTALATSGTGTVGANLAAAGITFTGTAAAGTLKFTSATGANIEISETQGGTDKTGFFSQAATTGHQYSSTVTLSSSSPFTVGGTNPSVVGLSAGNVAVVNQTGTKLSSTIATNGMAAGDVSINGTTIVTDATTTSAKALATAINAKSDTTGVTATANATQATGFGQFKTISGYGSYSLQVGSVTVASVSDTHATPVDAAYIDSKLADSSVKTALSNVGITVSGSAVGGDLKFTSASGANISVTEGGTAAGSSESLGSFVGVNSNVSGQTYRLSVSTGTGAAVYIAGDSAGGVDASANTIDAAYIDTQLASSSMQTKLTAAGISFTGSAAAGTLKFSSADGSDVNITQDNGTANTPLTGSALGSFTSIDSTATNTYSFSVTNAAGTSVSLYNNVTPAGAAVIDGTAFDAMLASKTAALNAAGITYTGSAAGGDLKFNTADGSAVTVTEAGLGAAGGGFANTVGVHTGTTGATTSSIQMNATVQGFTNLTGGVTHQVNTKVGFSALDTGVANVTTSSVTLNSANTITVAGNNPATSAGLTAGTVGANHKYTVTVGDGTTNVDLNFDLSKGAYGTSIKATDVASAINNNIQLQAMKVSALIDADGKLQITSADARNITLKESTDDKVNFGVLGTTGFADTDASADPVVGDPAKAVTHMGQISLTGTKDLTIAGTDPTTSGLKAGSFGGANVLTVDAANATLSAIDSALKVISNTRASLGAYQNRFSSTVANLQANSESLSSARSRIMDTDFALETANLSRGQILQQAGTAMLAQANQLPNGVLSLLR